MEQDDVRVLRTDSALADFDRRLAAAGRGVFLVDYDGTLAPFTVDTSDARPFDGVPEVLDALAGTGRARVVVVTGRYLRKSAPVLGTACSTEIWGSHGRERLLPDGGYAVAGIDEYALQALTIADGWCAEVEAAGGRCEQKPGSLAFHWRGAGPAQVVRIRHLVTQNFRREAFEGVLELHNFDGGIELRAPGPGKGDVVRTILGETPAGIPVAYLGDDLTDEDAFKALQGRGLGVLVRPELRPTAADLWVSPPDGVIRLLGHWRDALAGAA